MKNLIACLLLGVTSLSIAQTRTSIASGDWNDGSNWSPTGVPQDGEDIIIASGHTMDIDGTPDITLDDVAITIDGVLNFSEDGFDVGNLFLTGNSGVLVSPSGSITESVGTFGEIFSSIVLDETVLWTACSNQTCIDIANALVDPDPEQNGTVTGGSSGILLPQSGNPLPVEMTYFKAQMEGTKVLLTWQTASELNNDHFEVERSFDGINFDILGTVQGNGTTTEIQNYEFVDHTPGSSYNYYRLRQVDFDGEFEYSRTKTVTGDQVSQAPMVRIYPNPANANLFIKSDRGVYFNRVELLNMQGQVVMDLTDAKVDGGEETTVLLPSLPEGPYFLRYQTLDGSSGIQRVIIAP